jgi:hypothetical protein
VKEKSARACCPPRAECAKIAFFADRNQRVGHAQQQDSRREATGKKKNSFRLRRDPKVPYN